MVTRLMETGDLARARKFAQEHANHRGVPYVIFKIGDHFTSRRADMLTGNHVKDCETFWDYKFGAPNPVLIETIKPDEKCTLK